MATLITSGVDFAYFFNELRSIIRQEITQVSQLIAQPAAEIGGIDLAREITGLSKARIYTLVSTRQMPHSKRGNKLYFNRVDLTTWVQQGSRYGKEVAYA